MEPIKSKYAVCLYHRNTEGKILAVSRKNDTTKFGLPGGKVDDGETPAQAIVREVAEETGLTLTEARPVFIRVSEPGEDGVSYVTTAFVGNVSGSISTQETGVVSWLPEEKLISGPFGRYNAALFKAVNFSENS